MIPNFLHEYILKACLKSKKPLVTASYTTKEILKYNKEAKKLNIPVIFEMGCDPGIDHLVTLMMIDEVR